MIQKIPVWKDLNTDQEPRTRPQAAPMSITKRIFFGAAASWFSRGVTIVLGLVLMPVLFRTLPKEELGLWLLLGQSAAILGVLDFGFGVTLTRRLAFAKGKSGSDPNAILHDESRSEIADLLATGLRIYRILAFVAFLVSLGLGFLYLRSIDLGSVSLATVWTAWAILCLSYALTFWAAPWTCLLQGVGHVGWDAIVASFTGALTLITQIVVALSGGGIVALAIAAAIGALVQRIAILGFAKRKQPDLFALKGRWRTDWFREMGPLAGRAWLTALGAALILYTDQFVIASLKGSAEIPAYRAAWILVHNLTVVAVTFAGASGVFVSHLWQTGEHAPMQRLLERNLRFGWLTMLGGAAVLLFQSDTLFNLWLGPGNFIGYPVILAFLFTEALEAQAYIISTTSRATGDEAFAWSSLVAGVVKVILSVFLVQKWGLLGVALGTVIALLVTNHWYVPFRGLRRVGYSRRRLVSHTIVPASLWFLLLSGLLFFLDSLLAESTGWVRLVVATITAALAFAVALWVLFLDEPMRRRILFRVRGIVAVV